MDKSESKMSISLFDDIIFLLFAFWLIVDSLNGFLLRNGSPVSVSQIYKLLVALIVLVRCCNCISIIQFVLFSIAYLSIYIVNLICLDEKIDSSVILLSKLLTTIIFFIYFIQIRNTNAIYFKKKAYLVLTTSFVVFAINLILGCLGWGFRSYGGSEGFGSRGFFYAINELTGVLIVLIPWAFYYVKTNYSFKLYLLFSAILFFFSYTLSTKSGIVATLFSCLLIAYLYGNKIEKRIVLFAFILLILGAFTIIQIIINSDLPLVRRISYFIDNNGLINALTSNRFLFWAEEKADFYNASIFTQLLGLGGGRTVEMDPFDALLNCGFVGLTFLLCMYVILLLRPICKRYIYCKYNKVIFISNFFLILMSIGGGHVMFSSMAGMLIALSNALLIDNRKELLIKRILIFIIAKKLQIKVQTQ